MRILVTGSRNWTDREAIEEALTGIVAPDYTSRGAVLIHGAARGADRIAHELAREWEGWTVDAYPADWKKHGNRAGPIRNSEMLGAYPDICLAFPLPGSKGTWDMVRKASAAGIEVRIMPPKPEHGGEESQ